MTAERDDRGPGEATGVGLPVRARLWDKLVSALKPLELVLDNESPMHGLPASAEKHFRLVIVASAFEGRSRVERQRLIHEALAEDLRTQIHALSIQAFTPDEWDARGGRTSASPPCLGGGKREGLG